MCKIRGRESVKDKINISLHYLENKSLIMY